MRDVVEMESDDDSASVGALASECLSKSKSDRERAVRLFCREIKKPENASQLRDFIVQGARYFIRRAENKVRVSLADCARAAGSDDTSGLAEVGRITLSWLDDWLLPTGHRLGDANAEILAAAIEKYNSDASGAMKKASFSRALASKLGLGKTVRDSLSESQVIAIWESVS